MSKPVSQFRISSKFPQKLAMLAFAGEFAPKVVEGQTAYDPPSVQSP